MDAWSPRKVATGAVAVLAWKAELGWPTVRLTARVTCTAHKRQEHVCSQVLWGVCSRLLVGAGGGQASQGSQGAARTAVRRPKHAAPEPTLGCVASGEPWSDCRVTLDDTSAPARRLSPSQPSKWHAGKHSGQPGPAARQQRQAPRWWDALKAPSRLCRLGSRVWLTAIWLAMLCQMLVSVPASLGKSTRRRRHVHVAAAGLHGERPG